MLDKFFAALQQIGRTFTTHRGVWIRAGLLLLPILAMYYDTLLALVETWTKDDNNSHGMLIPPLAIYIAWRKMPRFTATAFSPATVMGILGVLGSLAVFFVGRLGAEFFMTRMSGILLLGSMMVFFFGWRHLQVMMFPLFLLALAVPIPAIIFNTIALPLQALASLVSAEALTVCGVPVLRDGNVLMTPNAELGVAEACSGLRSLVSLIALAVILGYLRWQGLGQRTLLLLLAIPVALVLNINRIVVTGIIADQWSTDYAMGFYHEFSGWVVFILAFAILYGLSSLIHWVWPSPEPEEI